MIPTFCTRSVWGVQSYYIFCEASHVLSEMSERKSGAISGHFVRLYGSFLFTQETRNIWQNKCAVITCDKVMNICLLILKCLLSSIYQIWLGLECKQNKYSTRWPWLLCSQGFLWSIWSKITSNDNRKCLWTSQTAFVFVIVVYILDPPESRCWLLSLSSCFISLTLQMLVFVVVFVFYILDLSPDAGLCVCLCVLYSWPLPRCWSTSRAASPPSPTSQPTLCPLSTSTRFLSSSTWK